MSFDQPQPQATRDLKASLDDEDGEDSPSWQWSKSMDKDAADEDWMPLTGAMTAARKPTASDVGYYLRATVAYTDSFDKQTASGVTANPVEARTVGQRRLRSLAMWPTLRWTRT